MAGSPTCFALGPPALSHSTNGPTGENFVTGVDSMHLGDGLYSVDIFFSAEMFDSSLESLEPLLSYTVNGATANLVGGNFLGPDFWSGTFQAPGPGATRILSYTQAPTGFRSISGIQQISFTYP